MEAATKKNRVPVVEILSEATDKVNDPITSGVNENVVDLVGNGVSAVKVFVGKNAFRIYEATTGMIGKNSVGTLQGMVKSADGRMCFRVVSEVGEKFEIVAFLAGLAGNIKKAAPEFKAVWVSQDSPAVKAAHFSRLARAVGGRTVVGAVTAGVGTIYDALTGWCLIGGLAGGTFESTAQECVAVLKDAKLTVDKVGTEIADFTADPTMYIVEIKLGQRTVFQPGILPQSKF